jgi:hypothetical protein
VSVTSSFGTWYYVDPVNGNDASPSGPYKTIAKGLGKITVGDTLYIRGGYTYYENGLKVDGIAQNIRGPARTYIDAYDTGNGYPTVVGTDVDFANSGPGTHGILIKNCKYLTIRQLQFQRFNQSGIEVDGATQADSNNNTVEYCNTWRTGSSGIRTTNSSSIAIHHCNVQDACLAWWQECITADHVNNIWVYNNNVQWGGGPNGGEAIDLKVGCTNGYMRNNWINQVNRMNLYIDGWDKDSYSIDIYKNLAQNGGGPGISICTEAGNTNVTKWIRVWDNIVAYNASGINFTANGGGPTHKVDDVKVFHNTFDHCANGVYLSNIEATNVVIKYNIITNCSTQKIWLNGGWNNTTDPGYNPSNIPAGLTVFQNLVWGGTGWEGHLGGNNLHVDPSYWGLGGIPAQYTLNSNSPARNQSAGTDASFVSDDYGNKSRGTTRDLGAFEY